MRDDPELALIVGAARSGTTLLRLILDTHPEIVCPAEAGLPGLLGHLTQVWHTIELSYETESASRLAVADPGVREDPVSPPRVANGNAKVPAPLEPPAVGRAAIREAAVAPMRHYCSLKHKRIYCDKSLDSVQHLDVVLSLFPNVKCMLMFRHVMDTVASGIEASPWGFHGYGYGPFVQASPHNFVAALVNYWLTHVDQALRWEEAHPDVCKRIRYEELVSAPKRTVSDVLDFLGVEPDLSVLDRVFEGAHMAAGPGDYKVSYTSAIRRSSVGRGKRIPVAMVPPPLLDAVNSKLEALGYPSLTDAWNAEGRSDAGLVAGSSGRRLAVLMKDVEVTPSTNDGSPGSFAVVSDDDPHLRWVIEPSSNEIRQGDGEVESVITGSAEDLFLMIAREENLGVLLRSGRIRHLTGREDVPDREVAEIMRKVLDLLTPTSGLDDAQAKRRE